MVVFLFPMLNSCTAVVADVAGRSWRGHDDLEQREPVLGDVRARQMLPGHEQGKNELSPWGFHCAIVAAKWCGRGRGGRGGSCGDVFYRCSCIAFPACLALFSVVAGCVWISASKTFSCACRSSASFFVGTALAIYLGMVVGFLFLSYVAMLHITSSVSFFE